MDSDRIVRGLEDFKRKDPDAARKEVQAKLRPGGTAMFNSYLETRDIVREQYELLSRLPKDSQGYKDAMYRYANGLAVMKDVERDIFGPMDALELSAQQSSRARDSVLETGLRVVKEIVEAGQLSKDVEKIEQGGNKERLPVNLEDVIFPNDNRIMRSGGRSAGQPGGVVNTGPNAVGGFADFFRRVLG